MDGKLATKLAEAKVELQKLMTRSRWRKEWQDQMTKWIEKIFLMENAYEGGQVVIFPTDSGSWYIFFADMRGWSGHGRRDVNDALRCYSLSKEHLSAVPINLFALIYQNLVISFGGSFSLVLNSAYANDNYLHYLWTDDNYKRHRQVIRSSAPHLFPTCGISAFDLSGEFDGWEPVTIAGIQLEYKFLASQYIGNLLWTLNHHQIYKMIEHYFCHRNSETSKVDKSNKLTHTAKRFSCSLGLSMNRNGNLSQGWSVDAFGLGFDLTLIGESKNRESMKNFNFQNVTGNSNGDAKNYWQLAMKNSHFVEVLGDLTAADATFIVSCFIDAKYDAKEITEEVKKLESEGCESKQFPSQNDDFTNFDPPHLRGLLAQTVLSKKLAKYDLGMKEINEGKFADIAPIALTKIVAEYYSVDID